MAENTGFQVVVILTGLTVDRATRSFNGERDRSHNVSAHRAFHLKLDELVHLDGVFHRQFFHQGLDEAANNQGRRLGFGEATALQVEELFTPILETLAS